MIFNFISYCCVLFFQNFLSLGVPFFIFVFSFFHYHKKNGNEKGSNVEKNSLKFSEVHSFLSFFLFIYSYFSFLFYFFLKTSFFLFASFFPFRHLFLLFSAFVFIFSSNFPFFSISEYFIVLFAR